MFIWKNYPENMSNDKLYFWLNLVPLFLSLLITIAIFAIIAPLPDKLPLFYSLPWGEGQLATHQQFFILPAVIVLITFFNLIISRNLHPSQFFFKRILLFTPFIISLILVISFIKIILNFV